LSFGLAGRHPATELVDLFAGKGFLATAVDASLLG